MKSVRNHLGLFAVLALLGASQGCSKTTDYGLGNPQGDQFSNSDRSAKIQDLESDYGLTIDIVDQSYADEHNVNRVLVYLAANEGTLKGQLQNVAELDIVSPNNGLTSGLGASNEGSVQWMSTGGTDTNGNATYKVSINCAASQATLSAGFQMFANSYQGSAILTSAAARIGVVQIVDMVGLSSGDATNFAQNLISAAQGLDFTTSTAREYASVIQVDSIFAMGNQGTVLVDSTASSGDIQTFLTSVLNLAKHLDTDLQTVNTALGRNVTYQPDTLIPAEVSQGIVTLTAAIHTIVNPDYQALPIMIGRRTETQASIVQQQGVLLIAFNASTSDIANAVSLQQPNNTTAVTQTIQAAVAYYAQSQVTFSAQPSDFGVSDPTSAGSLLVVQNAISALEQAAPPATLQADAVTSITPSASVPPNVQNGTLQLGLTAIDPNAVAAALSQWVVVNANNLSASERQADQQSYVSSLETKYPNLSWQVASYDLSSAAKTQALSSGAQTFEQVVKTGAILSQVGITAVVLTAAAPSPDEAALVSADRSTLTVDLYLITSKVLNQVLQAAIPAPTPAPPTPKPVAAAE